MLRIRATEKRALERADRSDYVEHVLTILRQSWKAEIDERSEPAVRALLDGWVDALRPLGVETEKPLAKALHVFFATLVDFSEDALHTPWAQAILNDPGGTETSKAAALEVTLFRRYEERG